MRPGLPPHAGRRALVVQRPHPDQPPGLFLCHQNDRGDDRARVRGGWVGCHDGDHVLALRVAVGKVYRP
ncbi:DUF6283 family protein [Streptomyces sp. NPDC056580]|uniref:DUF6283 family protein n=1 Tax=Streptomyces sp. NPDC056580 TaxID=3345872 RepID=UPI0036C24689